MIDPQDLVMGFDFGTKKIGIAMWAGPHWLGHTDRHHVAARDGIPKWARD